MSLPLDPQKQVELLGYLRLGCSRRNAASRVGCCHRTIANIARRDPDFARKLKEAEAESEIACLEKMRDAASNVQHWRAAAWLLEHRLPQRYSLHRHNAITADQFGMLLVEVSSIVVGQVPAERQAHVVRQLQLLTRELKHEAKS